MSSSARRSAIVIATVAAASAIAASPALAQPAGPSTGSGDAAAAAAQAGPRQVASISSDARQLAVDPTRNTLYGAEANGRVQFIDGRTRTLTGGSGPVGDLGPDAVAVDPAHNWVFATGVSSGSLYRIVGGTDIVDSSAPEAATYQGMAVNTRTDAVYVGNDNMVEAVNGRTLLHRGSTALPGGEFDYVDDLAVNPASDRLYVTDRTAVHVLDGRTLRLLHSVTLPDGADQVAVNAATGRVYVTGFSGVSVLSATGTLLASVHVQATPFDVAVNVAKNRVYVTSANDGAAHGYLTEIDGATDSLVGRALVQGPAGYVTVDSRTDTTFVQAFPTYRTAPRILVFRG